MVVVTKELVDSFASDASMGTWMEGNPFTEGSIVTKTAQSLGKIDQGIRRRKGTSAACIVEGNSLDSTRGITFIQTASAFVVQVVMFVKSFVGGFLSFECLPFSLTFKLLFLSFHYFVFHLASLLFVHSALIHSVAFEAFKISKLWDCLPEQLHARTNQLLGLRLQQVGLASAHGLSAHLC